MDGGDDVVGGRFLSLAYASKIHTRIILQPVPNVAPCSLHLRALRSSFAFPFSSCNPKPLDSPQRLLNRLLPQNLTSYRASCANSLTFLPTLLLPAVFGASSRPCWMTRAFYARLRHHSLTCFSQPVAYKRPVSLASATASPSTNIVSLDLKLNSSTLSSIRPPSNLCRAGKTSANELHTSTMNGTNGTVRAKRKQHPGSVTERPQKQHRAINGKESAGQNTPEVSLMYDEETIEIEDTRILPGMADTAEWQACIENVVRNVVSIRFCQTCSFDTDPALTSEATGFVVDAERGYVSIQAAKLFLLTFTQIHHDQSACGRSWTFLGILHIR
jgi:hypothetical protein